MKTTALINSPQAWAAPDVVLLECDHHPASERSWPEMVNVVMDLLPEQQGARTNGWTEWRWVAAEIAAADRQYMQRFLRRRVRRGFAGAPYSDYYLFAEVEALMEITPIYPAEGGDAG